MIHLSFNSLTQRSSPGPGAKRTRPHCPNGTPRTPTHTRPAAATRPGAHLPHMSHAGIAGVTIPAGSPAPGKKAGVPGHRGLARGPLRPLRAARGRQAHPAAATVPRCREVPPPAGWPISPAPSPPAASSPCTLHPEPSSPRPGCDPLARCLPGPAAQPTHRASRHSPYFTSSCPSWTPPPAVQPQANWLLMLLLHPETGDEDDACLGHVEKIQLEGTHTWLPTVPVPAAPSVSCPPRGLRSYVVIAQEQHLPGKLAPQRTTAKVQQERHQRLQGPPRAPRAVWHSALRTSGQAYFTHKGQSGYDSRCRAPPTQPTASAEQV